MKNFTKPKFSALFVFTALFVVITFSMVSCDSGNGDTTIPDPCENGHDFQYTSTTAPTCTEDGFDLYTCSRTPSVSEQRNPVAKLGHQAPAGYPATCTTEGNTGTGNCERCGEPVTGETIPALGHDFTGSWLNDASQHWKECTRDGCTAISGNGTIESVKANHNYPADNCTAPCTDCGTASQNITHDFTGSWLNDANQHWKECTRDGCTVISGNGTTESVKANHNYPADNCTAPCTDCGTASQNITHDFTGSWLQDASQHWKECTRCTAISGNGTTESVKAIHTPNNVQSANCLAPNVCTVCEYVITPAKQSHNYPVDNCTAPCSDCGTASPNSSHDFSGLWLRDANQHWKECTRCTAISGNGTTESVKENHSFDGIQCIVCGEPDPITAFFGTWTRTQGNYQPYTITITANSFRFEDRNENYINHADITWTKDTNTATTHGVTGTYSGIFTGANSNPSLSYPNGYTINGTRTSLFWEASQIPTGFFIALSEDGQTLYVATSNSVYDRAGFRNSMGNNQMGDDSIFTRVSP